MEPPGMSLAAAAVVAPGGQLPRLPLRQPLWIRSPKPTCLRTLVLLATDVLVQA